MSEEIKNVNVNNGEKKELMKIVVNPQKFEGHSDSHITNTFDLSNMINQMFGKVFNDYVGCSIYVMDGNAAIPPVLSNRMVMGGFYVDLRFEKNRTSSKTGIIDNLESPVGDEANASAFQKLSRICNNTYRTWFLNKETKEALTEFVAGYSYEYTPDNLKKNWENDALWNYRTIEESAIVDQFTNSRKVVLRVIGLDLNKIVSKIFGTTDDNDNKYEYMCQCIARSSKGMNGLYGYLPSTPHFAIQIIRHNTKIIAAMQDSLGQIPNAGMGYVPYRQ